MTEVQQYPWHDYKITKVFGCEVDKAERFAISNLFPKPAEAEAVDDMPDKLVVMQAAMRHIQDRWRGRMNALRASGWKRFSKGKEWLFAQTCPPVTVKTNKPLRVCHEYLICPFCWTRYYARELFGRVEFAMYGSNRVSYLDAASRQLQEYQPVFVDLVTVVTKWWYPVAKYTVEDRFREIQKHRSRFLDQSLPNEGAFALWTIEPDQINEGREWAWLVTQRVLALINPGQEDPPRNVVDDDVHCTRNVSRYAGATRKNSVPAVGQVCLYPAGLLRGPAEMVLQILKARYTDADWAGVAEGKYPQRGGVRMSSYYGALRNREKRLRGVASALPREEP